MTQKQHVDNDIQDQKIVIVAAPSLGRGETANRAAVLATGLASCHPEIVGPALVTADGITWPGFTQIPIAVLMGRDGVTIPDIAMKAQQKGCTTLVYLSRAQSMQSYQAYADAVSGLLAHDLDIDAVILYGPKRRVNKITGNLPALR